MKKFLLAATTVAALSAMSTAALANVNLDTGVGLTTYASELITNGTTALNGAVLDVDHVLGFGVSNTQTRYVRYTLTNGVFATAVDAGDLTVNGTVAVVQGGAAGQNFVIFQFTAGGDLPEADPVSFALGSGVGVTITNKAAGVSLKFDLYETAADAAAGGTAGRLHTRTNTVAGIASGLTFTTVVNTTTAEVADEYKSFVDGINPTLAKIGNLTHKAAVGVVRPADGAQVVITDLVAAGTKVIVTTDSNWNPVTNIADVYLSSDADCGGVAIAATARTANTTEIIVDVAESDGLGICYQANGTTPIEVQAFTITGDVVPAAGTDTSDRGPIALGDFKRNGTILKAAFAEAATAGTGYSSAAHMTNLGASAAPFAVRCLTNAGAVAGTPGSIPANTAVRYGVTSTLGCPADGTLRGIELTFAVPEGRVIGSVVRQNTTTGQASFDNMIGSK
jgi:hypothetical protein